LGLTIDTHALVPSTNDQRSQGAMMTQTLYASRGAQSTP